MNPFICSEIVTSRLRKAWNTPIKEGESWRDVLEQDKMKIALIAPGIIPLENLKFGAVETIALVYKEELEKLGYEVVIFNTKDLDYVVKEINDGGFDVAHLLYDCYFDILSKIKCPSIISSAYPYINNPAHWYGDNYHPIFSWMINNANKHKIFAYSEKDRIAYLSAGVHPRDVILMKIGASGTKFLFNETPSMARRTICLGQIDPRKRQNLLLEVPNLDFVGRGPWLYNKGNYLGEVSTEHKYQWLTEYGNMALLSTGENGTPLAIKEGLAAGLGIVCSEGAAHELPRDLPFIRVLSELECQSTQMISQAIEINRIASLSRREEIRNWALAQWDWPQLIKEYEGNIISLLKGKNNG